MRNSTHKSYVKAVRNASKRLSSLLSKVALNKLVDSRFKSMVLRSKLEMMN